MLPCALHLWCARDLIGSTSFSQSHEAEENLGDHGLHKGMRNDDPRCGQAQDGAGQAADQNVKGAGV